MVPKKQEEFNNIKAYYFAEKLRKTHPMLVDELITILIELSHDIDLEAMARAPGFCCVHFQFVIPATL